MKFTPKRGLFRLMISAAAALICLPIAKDIELYIVCAIFFVGWLFCWLIGGFFDMD